MDFIVKPLDNEPGTGGTGGCRVDDICGVDCSNDNDTCGVDNCWIDF